MANSLQTLRPNGVLLNTASWATYGSPSPNTLEQAVRDASNTTGVQVPAFPPTGVTLQFHIDNWTIPALAQVRSVTPRIILGGTVGAFPMTFYLYSGGWGPANTIDQIPGAMYDGSAMTTTPTGAAWTQDFINAVEFAIHTNNFESTIQQVAGVYVDVAYNQAPVVSAVATSPASPLTTTAKPTISWTYSDGTEADAQDRYRVKIYQGTGTVADPDNTAAFYDSDVRFATVSSGSQGSHVVTTPLPGSAAGTSYRVYVKAADAGSNGRYSAWATATFTITIANPQAPTITTPTIDSALARIAVRVNGSENMLTSNQSSLETNTTGWEAVPSGNVTIARSTVQARHGAASLSMTSGTSGTMQARTTVTSGAVVPVVGRQYTALASFRAATAGRSVRVSIAWYNASDGLISTSDGSTVTSNTTGWTQASVTATAPANAAKAYVILSVISTAAGGEVHYVDQISFAPGASTTWGKGGYSGIFFPLERSIDGGTTWQEVRGSLSTTGAMNSQEITFYDYEVARGVIASYRARAQVLDTELGQYLVSGYSGTATAPVMAASGWWLKDPLVPATNMQIEVAPDFSFRRKEPQSVFEPLGRSVSVAVSDGVRGVEGQMTVWVKTAARYAKLETLVTSGHVLRLEDALGRAWYVKFGAATEWATLRAVPITGETTPIRHLHAVTLPFVEVAAPISTMITQGTPTG